MRKSSSRGTTWYRRGSISRGHSALLISTSKNGSQQGSCHLFNRPVHCFSPSAKTTCIRLDYSQPTCFFLNKRSIPKYVPQSVNQQIILKVRHICDVHRTFNFLVLSWKEVWVFPLKSRRNRCRSSYSKSSVNTLLELILGGMIKLWRILWHICDMAYIPMVWYRCLFHISCDPVEYFLTSIWFTETVSVIEIALVEQYDLL